MKFKINNDEWEIKEISNAEMNIMVSSDIKETFTHGTTQYDEFVIYLNKEGKGLRKTLIHELTHCFLFEYGHNQHQREYTNEDICEISASFHDGIHETIEKYFKNR